MFKRLIVSIFLVLFSSAAHAGNMVTLDKSKIRLVIPPGQVKTGMILAENNSEEPKSVKVYAEDWEYIQPFDGSKDFYPLGTTRLSCGEWISYSPAEFTLGPFSKQEVNYSVRVPEGAQGGHYGVLFFENSVGKPGTEGVGVNVAVRMACLFYIESEGTVKSSMDISDFSVTRESNQKPLQVGLTFKNTGNTDITCGGTYDIMDAQGMVLARGEMSQVYMLPGNSGRSSGSWSLPIKKGSYSLVLTLDLGKAKEEAGLGRGPIEVRESLIQIGDNGELLKAGELK